MKSIRPLSALLVCAALYGQSVSALAAADLTLTAPTEAVPGGSRSYFTITSPTPGFLTMTLDDASGTEVALLFDMEEIHTNENQLVFSAVNEDGSPLPAGSYSVSGELLDQFGKSIGNVSGSFSVAPPITQQADIDDEDDTEDGTEDTEDGTEDSGTSSKPSDKESDAKDKEDKQPAAQKPSVQSGSSSSGDIEYTTSSDITLGEEGYQIGVGVSDTGSQDDAG